MVAPVNRFEQFTPAPRELCCNCRQPIGESGAWYWGRVRVCKLCHQEHMEWDREDMLAQSDKERLMRLTGLGMLATSGSIVLYCIVSLFT